MYTYERLYRLCSEDSNDSDIAHYLLTHLNSLEKLTVKKISEDIGISKASLHRFFSKGGYDSFRDLILILNEEIKQKKRFEVGYEEYKEKMCFSVEEFVFDENQIRLFIKKINNAKRVAVYGPSLEISCFKRLYFYLFTHQIDVILLDRWDLREIYEVLNTLESQDIFIMIDTSWSIQLVYENSINTQHIINLERVNKGYFQKFYIGEANCNQYLNFYNIRIQNKYYYLYYIYLNLLDEKISDLLRR